MTKTIKAKDETINMINLLFRQVLSIDTPNHAINLICESSSWDIKIKVLLDKLKECMEEVD